MRVDDLHPSGKCRVSLAPILIALGVKRRLRETQHRRHVRLSGLGGKGILTALSRTEILRDEERTCGELGLGIVEIGRLGHQSRARSDIDASALDLQLIYIGVAIHIHLADHVHLFDVGGAFLVEFRRPVGEFHITDRQFTVLTVLERSGRIEFQLVGSDLTVVEQASRVGVLESSGRKHGTRTVVEFQGIVQVQFPGNLHRTQVHSLPAGEAHFGNREFTPREDIQRRKVFGDILRGQLARNRHFAARQDGQRRITDVGRRQVEFTLHIQHGLFVGVVIAVQVDVAVDYGASRDVIGLSRIGRLLGPEVEIHRRGSGDHGLRSERAGIGLGHHRIIRHRAHGRRLCRNADFRRRGGCHRSSGHVDRRSGSDHLHGLAPVGQGGLHIQTPGTGRYRNRRAERSRSSGDALGYDILLR